MARTSLLVVVLCVFFVREANALRCGTHVISAQDTMSRVLEYCGEPTARSEKDKVLIRRYVPSQAETRQYIRYEFWVYDRGPRNFVEYLRFRDNLLEEIRDGDYGGREYSQPQFCQSPPTYIYQGASQLEISNRCGSPSWQVHVEDRIIPEERYLDIETFSVVSVDEWTYDFGFPAGRSTFRFEDGILRQVANASLY